MGIGACDGRAAAFDVGVVEQHQQHVLAHAGAQLLEEGFLLVALELRPGEAHEDGVEAAQLGRQIHRAGGDHAGRAGHHGLAGTAVAAAQFQHLVPGRQARQFLAHLVELARSGLRVILVVLFTHDSYSS